MEKIEKGHPLSQSADIVKENIETLKRLFPTIVKEDKIDFNELKALINEEVENNEEYYRFTWAGKSEARREANKPSTATLRPNKADSKNWDTTQNIFIEGDNLEVLKLLQKSYVNKIKMIYIDPPYNTGKDFVYKDNYTDNLGNYLSLTGQTDAEGRKTSTNTESDGRYHSNWLNMMYPRLKLARNLLSDDGIIFISIDNNELSNLKLLCNDVFGEECFIETMVVNRASEIATENTVQKHEYLHCYSKNIHKFKVTGVPKYSISRGTVGNEGQTMPIITFPKGLKCYGIANGTYLETRKIIGSSENIENFDPIIVENGILINDVRMKAKWRSSNDMRNFFNNNCQPTVAKINGIIEEIYFENDRFNPQIKKATFEKIPSLFLENRRGSKYIEDLGLGGFFENPKDLKYIFKITNIVTDTNSVILDFFAGSGTTAHAVMQLNAEDNGNRKTISVQLPEATEESSEAYKAGYQNIAEITKERVRRAGDKIIVDKKAELASLKKSMEGKMFQEEIQQKMEQIQTTIDHLDIGFKAFKLDSSNIKSWDGNLDQLQNNLFDSQDNIKEDRTEEDLLFEILLKYGLDLTVPIEQKNVENCTIYNIGSGVLFVCISDKITTEVATSIGKWKEEIQPTTCRVLFKDNGFKDDVAKTNSIQILRQFGIEECNSI